MAEIVSVFPTIVKVIAEDAFDWRPSAQILLATELNDTRQKSRDTYVLNDERVRPLAAWILGHANLYAQEQLGFLEPLRLTQSWVFCREQLQPVHMHSHANSLVSGVFYPSVEEGTSVLRLHKSVAKAQTFVMEPRMRLDMVNQTYDIPVKAGMLILFPSYLAHSVPPNPSITKRFSLSFNTMTEHLGYEQRLTAAEVSQS